MKSTKKSRVYFYLRNSTDTGQQDYEYQRNALQTYLDNRNDLELIKIYADKITGFEADRPDMTKLLSDVDNGLVDQIWCTEYMRLSRDAINLQVIVKHCSEKGVNIFFKNQNLNTLDDNGDLNEMTKMMISILSNFGEMDASNFKSKGVQGKISKAKLGNYVGGVLPTGYTYINGEHSKKIIIDEKQKKIVEYVYDCIGNKKMTLNATAINLNNFKNIDSDFMTVMKSKNYGLKNGKCKSESWNVSQVKNIINCTWYALGYRFYKEEKIILNDNLKFIDIDLFNRANEQLKSNQYLKTKTKHEYIIKDLIYCSCGSKMLPKNTENRFNYKCKKNIQNDIDKSFKCDESKSVKIEQIENTIFLLIKNKLPEFKLSVQKKENKEEQINSKINENNKIIDSIKSMNIVKLTDQRKRTISVYERFGGDNDEFENKLSFIDKDLKNQKSKISELESGNKQLSISLSNLDITSEFEQNIKIIENDKNLIKYYIDKLIKKIVVCGGLKGQLVNVVKIEWNDSVDNTDTYLFYYSKLSINKNYYFLNEISGVSVITWNVEKKSFRVLDLENKKNNYLTIDEIINYFKTLPAEIKELDETEPETTIMMLSKDYPVFNLIKVGQAALKIVTPFK